MKTREPNQKRIAKLVRELLVELGEDPDREGLKKTPVRVAKSLAFLTQGNRQKVKTVVNGAYFTSGTNHMVILKDIELYSMCEHHMLPFYGKCAIGYISQGKVLGVSKLARIVDMFARRLQIQERMTEEIANAIKVYNASRAARREFVKLANDHCDVITATKRSAVLKAAWFMTKAEYTEKLDEASGYGRNFARIRHLEQFADTVGTLIQNQIRSL